MRAARLHGPGDLRIDTIETPTPGPHDVIIRVAACGICGSDLGYVDAGGVAGPVTTHIGLGHELSGTIAAIGSAAALAMLDADESLAALISHRYNFADFSAAFAMARNAGEAAKVMVTFDAD